MLVRPALFWLLVAVLALSLLGNVVLAAAYSTTQFRATLAEQTSSRLSQERDEAQRQADNRQHELEDLRRQLAASPTPAAASTAAATATPAPTPAAAAAAATPSPEERATLVAIETKVEQIRGLAPLADVPLSFLDRDGLRQFLAQSFEKDYPPEEREADQRRYQALGLLKPSDDLTKQLLDLYSQQVIGLYDPDTKRMYLIGNHAPLSPDDEVTFAHEFTHALQDQHFDLNKIAPNHPDNLDRSLAVHGVIEGDAVLTMGLWAREALSKQEQQTLGQGSSSDTGLAQAPRILREDLLFPYTSGYQFVAQLHRSGTAPGQVCRARAASPGGPAGAGAESRRRLERAGLQRDGRVRAAGAAAPVPCPGRCRAGRGRLGRRPLLRVERRPPHRAGAADSVGHRQRRPGVLRRLRAVTRSTLRPRSPDK